jgi:tRNA (guanine37-N1)-methyltransferase
VKLDIVTLFPDWFDWFALQRHVANALAGGTTLTLINPRDHTPLGGGQVDDAPFGGGAGMVLRADVVDAAVGSVADDRPLVFLTPHGRKLTQRDAQRFAAAPGIILLCGRYEGVDQRVIEARDMQEVSIGDYVLSGGELAALVLLDAAVRLLPGVMGAADSAAEESFSRHLLEYPHYTRPAEWQGRHVPEILLSGHHAAIAAWRQSAAEHMTRERRPDLWEAHTAETCSAPVASPATPP